MLNLLRGPATNSILIPFHKDSYREKSVTSPPRNSRAENRFAEMSRSVSAYQIIFVWTHEIFCLKDFNETIIHE